MDKDPFLRPNRFRTLVAAAVVTLAACNADTSPVPTLDVPPTATTLRRGPQIPAHVTQEDLQNLPVPEDGPAIGVDASGSEEQRCRYVETNPSDLPEAPPSTRFDSEGRLYALEC